MKNILKKGFTLIELLIVIGILGILIAAVLFTLNPAEAQRKGRDVQRLRDIGTIQTVMENLVQDGVLVNNLNKTSIGGVSACATSWLGVNICNYASKLPVDPVNAATTVATKDTATTCIDSTDHSAGYLVVFSKTARTYEINVVQESKAGCSKILGDGGDGDWLVEVGTGLLLIGPDGTSTITDGS